MPIRIRWKEPQISGVEKPDRREIQDTSPGNTDGMPLFYTEDVKQQHKDNEKTSRLH